MRINKEFKNVGEKEYQQMLECAYDLFGEDIPNDEDEVYGQDVIARCFWKLLDTNAKNRLESIYHIDEDRMNMMLEMGYEVYCNNGGDIRLLDKSGYEYCFEWQEDHIQFYHGPY